VLRQVCRLQGLSAIRDPTILPVLCRRWMDDDELLEEALDLTQNGLLLAVFSPRVRKSRYLVLRAARYSPECLEFAAEEVFYFNPDDKKSVELAIIFTRELINRGCSKDTIPKANWDLIWSLPDNAAKVLLNRRDLWPSIPDHAKRNFPNCEAYQCCICYEIPQQIFMCTVNGCGYICMECSVKLSALPLPRCPACKSSQLPTQRSPGGQMFYGVRDRAAESAISAELKEMASKENNPPKRRRIM
jgi:hypothetical protein